MPFANGTWPDFTGISARLGISPSDVQLYEAGEGCVRADICLTNGANRGKHIQGEYHVDGGLIDRIWLIDGTTYALKVQL